MVLWRGKLVFSQYIKGKQHKFGIKLYSLTEPFGLTFHFMIYSGKDNVLSGKAHSAKVVLKLMEGKLGKGHAIFMDNFYNSFLLALKLLFEKTYCTGTLREDQKYNPNEIKTAQLRKVESKAQHAEGIMVGKWRDKRTVLYKSSEYENNMVIVVNKKQQEKNKPLPIVQYNAHMKGVDRAHQLLSYYPCERKTLRWYKKIFIHALSMIVVKSQLLYNMHTVDKKMSLYDFRYSLIQSLLPQKQVAPLVTPPCNPIQKLFKLKNVTRR